MFSPQICMLGVIQVALLVIVCMMNRMSSCEVDFCYKNEFLPSDKYVIVKALPRDTPPRAVFFIHTSISLVPRPLFPVFWLGKKGLV